MGPIYYCLPLTKTLLCFFYRGLLQVCLGIFSKFFITFKTWRIQVETHTEKRVKYLRSDNGGEYTSEEFHRYCKEEWITRHFTTVYTPQQNALSKRLNRTMLEKVRSMLSEYGLPGEFWAEAVNTAVYLVNLSLSSAINFSTPSELRHKRMADYSRLKVFGCTTYLLTPKEHRTKLDPTSKKCHFLGYTSGVKGYRLWDPLARKVIVSRDVSFNELGLLKEGEISKTPRSDKRKSQITDIVVGDFDHFITNDLLQEGAPVHQEHD